MQLGVNASKRLARVRQRPADKKTGDRKKLALRGKVQQKVHRGCLPVARCDEERRGVELAPAARLGKLAETGNVPKGGQSLGGVARSELALGVSGRGDGGEAIKGEHPFSFSRKIPAGKD